MSVVRSFNVASNAHATGKRPALGRRVLVAEDSPITQDLLKLLLNQRGHEVDVAADGEQALAALRQQRYDVALLDFHLPKLDGLQVATIIRSEAGEHPVPRLIAITADMEGLLSQPKGGETFDQLLPKPLDIYDVAQVVEDQAEIAAWEAEARETEAAPEPTAPQRVHALESARDRRSHFEDLGYNFLTWPGDIDLGHLSARAMQASLGDPRFDGILIKTAVAIEDLSSIWNEKALYLLPIIDLTGKLGHIADFDGSRLTALESNQLDEVLRRFQDRRAHLHRDLQFSSDAAEKLVGRMFVTNKPLTPRYDPSSKWLVSYDVALDAAVVAREAESLCERGLLRHEFYDRFHVCPRCDSLRLHVREECAQCHSSNLEEQQYLHHFRCAYQGPEENFRRGDRLVCPKCRYELTHFGFDYDRPGSMVVCDACGHAASDPAVGFMCVDCGTHVDGDVASVRDVYAYFLTEQGTGFAELGHSLLGTASRALRFADLPLELVVALNAAAKKYNDLQQPFTLINIYYQNEREVVAEQGARAFGKVRDLFVENIRAALGDGALVVKGQSRDFALLQGVGPSQAKGEFDLVMVQAANSLRFDIGASFQAFGPEDFA
ncbi:MAG: response regulator [Hyphomicrobiales bacterium]